MIECKRRGQAALFVVGGGEFLGPEAAFRSALQQRAANSRIQIRTQPDTTYKEVALLMTVLAEAGVYSYVFEPDTEYRLPSARALPAAGQGEAARPQAPPLPLEVACYPDGTYAMTTVSGLKAADLLAHLLARSAGVPEVKDNPVILRGRDATPWAVMLTALGHARKAGFKTITFASPSDHIEPRLPVLIGKARPRQGQPGGLAAFGLSTRPAIGGARTSFFGSGAAAHHVCFVIDRSGSMLETFDAVRNETLISISRLRPTQTFHVILMGKDKPMELGVTVPKGQPDAAPVGQGRLLPAVDRYKQTAAEFLQPVRAEGKTFSAPAMARAFDVMDQADPRRAGRIIYLLTDAMPADADDLLKTIKERNARKGVLINTYLYGAKPPEAEKLFHRIAQDNGGRYKYVSSEE